LLTLRGGPDDETGGGSATTLLQAVEILAVDQRLDAPSENRVEKLRSVTLLVTPDQASLLDLGQNMGTLALSLRNPSDVAKAETEPATVNVLRYTQKDPNEAKGTSAPVAPNFLATAAAAAAKAAATATLRTDDPERTVVLKPETPRYLQTYTLRGRSTGRIMVRNE
jgi:Flp pilus assembly protein CpaB